MVSEKGWPKSWESGRLDEVSTIVDSLHKTSIYSESGLPIVRVKDRNGGCLDFSETLFVTEGMFDEFRKRHAPRGPRQPAPPVNRAKCSSSWKMTLRPSPRVTMW